MAHKGIANTPTGNPSYSFLPYSTRRGGLEADVIDAAAGPVCLILAEAEPS
jgi:hypothetical protein